MGKFRNYVLAATGFIILTATVSFVMAPYAVAQAVKAALVRDIDNAARNAVQFTLWDGAGEHDYVVPNGKILVIDECSTTNKLSGVFSILTFANGTGAQHYIPVIPGGPGFVGGRTTQIYADPGSTVSALEVGTFSDPANISCQCSGHLVSQ